MIKILIGGSPCTYWSIAQKNNRETEPSGIGWELFKNYLIAKEKFKPDIFLYENNKSAAQAIKDEIKRQFGVWDGTLLMPDNGARYIEINSALVSAQNRQRFYVHNCGEVGQPKDRGILLKDILESGVVEREKGYCLKHQAGNARDYFKKHHTNIALEPVACRCRGRVDKQGKGYAKYECRTDGKGSALDTNTVNGSMVAEPVRIPEYGANEKARALTAGYANKGCGDGTLIDKAFPQNPNKQKVDFIAEPVNTTADGKAHTIKAQYYKNAEANFITNGGFAATGGAEPIRVGTYPSEAKNKESKQYRVYSVEGKSSTLCGNGGGMGAKTGLYAIPVYYGAEAIEFDESGNPIKARSIADGKIYSVYEVKDGKITIKGKEYPIKLKDGFYIIRKLTVTECCRLQGMPDWWFLDNEGNKILSDSQAYKGLGNGWQLDTVKYILEHGLKNVPQNEELIVLSMYDGIATGRRILKELGFTKVKYYAYEIDKYCIKLTSYRYPDIIHCGDAFKIRNKGEIEKII